MKIVVGGQVDFHTGAMIRFQEEHPMEEHKSESSPSYVISLARLGVSNAIQGRLDRSD